MQVQRRVIADPNARVNPRVELQIRVLEQKGDLSTAFTSDEIKLVDKMGHPRYLAYLRELSQSIAEEHHFGGE